MAAKKSDQAAQTKANGSHHGPGKNTPIIGAATGVQPSLTISRNKHWRYISAFHGPWLQLPYELLETLVHSNYLSPRPRQTDPGVLYDLLKIRKLVDDASDLAVRAQNGTASSALMNSQNALNGLPGGALGMAHLGRGENAKLSPERKYRMRELATQKLAQAYRLDEVAASVATMQSTSSLDNVASLVLQRAPNNNDAKYVHFFHEKIPSRMIADYTPLTTLNDIIAFEPGHAAPFRTRGLVNIFKEDHIEAIKDLTEALSSFRLQQAKHKAGRSQLVSMKTVKEEAEQRKTWTRNWTLDNMVADDAQPDGFEMQLFFQRGNQCLKMACLYARIALEHFTAAHHQKHKFSSAHEDPDAGLHDKVDMASGVTAYGRAHETREIMRKYAKRALRDYTALFSNLDYAHTTPHEGNKKFFHRENDPRNDKTDGYTHTTPSLDSDDSQTSCTALIRHRPTNQHEQSSNGNAGGWSAHSIASVCEISTLLSSSPPTNLPALPTLSQALTLKSMQSMLPSIVPHREMITYHPFLLETLHSFLLAHCLLQTPPTALLRIANNAARVVRLADGYPFFLPPRSPARADWCEVLRRTGNWINLTASWESLCKSPQLPVNLDPTIHGGAASLSTNGGGPLGETETQEQKRNRIHKEAVMEALGDERVVDDTTFQCAVSAREKRAWQDISEESNRSLKIDSPKMEVDEASAAHAVSRETHDAPVARDEEYLIGTERAVVISRWILEAPRLAQAGAQESGECPTAKKRSRKVKPKRRVSIENGIAGMSLDTVC